MNYSEAIAKRVLEAILPGANLEYQPVQSNGEYDFNLRYDDGSFAAVVTLPSECVSLNGPGFEEK
jgi:hypothetical protein